MHILPGRPFFHYIGGKFRSVAEGRYPAPRFRTVIEPFAGAAGYSVNHAFRVVTLVEKDPAIAALWRWLIAASPTTIAMLPVPRVGQSLDDFKLCPEARVFLALWCTGGRDCDLRGPLAGRYRHGIQAPTIWTVPARAALAQRVRCIKHWRVVEGDYTMAPDVEATWFIDPPYQHTNVSYGDTGLPDFDALASWCKGRRGQVIVCEQAPATWLPFRPMGAVRGANGMSSELVFTQ